MKTKYFLRHCRLLILYSLTDLYRLPWQQRAILRLAGGHARSLRRPDALGRNAAERAHFRHVDGHYGDSAAIRGVPPRRRARVRLSAMDVRRCVRTLRDRVARVRHRQARPWPSGAPDCQHNDGRVDVVAEGILCADWESGMNFRPGIAAGEH